MYKIRDDEFSIEFMKEHGYKRIKCKSCGSYFWGFEEENCGEAPCKLYTFINNPPTRRRYSLREMRNTFLKFFEKRGHEIINPYPVIARWRDDLLVTIASIADFQPYVTSGVSEPPANPLVISQPCLRFEDIDKVGFTSGRHLTIFEMGGAHAFNKKLENKFIYWKNETIAYHHEFATRELGIPEDLITYKEHFWVGGGNAGPDVEGIIGGLEVSTLVFMKYKINPDGSLSETPIWTVDTGYGIERWTWLSSGSPTAFEVIYPDVYKWILKVGDIDIPNYVLEDIAVRISSLHEFTWDTIKPVIDEVAVKHGYDHVSLESEYSMYVDLMKSLDFSKSILFLIKDGGIPSNVKEGYLTRMLIRKLFNIFEKRSLEYSVIEDLFYNQYNQWVSDYPEIKDIYNVLFDIMKFEYKKYLEIIKKVPQIVRSYIKKGWRDVDTLIEIYDSYGIPPEYVKREASKHGIKVGIPKNFTELVSMRHLKQSVAVEEFREPLEDKIKSMRLYTEKLYYINPYWSEANARIIYKDKNYVILDRTIFYPGEGGQKYDTGYIISPDNRSYHVKKVEAIGDVILHYLDEDSDLRVGDTVRLKIDWDRRYQLMKHHTATHILLSAIRKILGGHVWQAGVEKEVDQARLDVTHHRLPTLDEIKVIEYEANKIVSKCIDVSIYTMERGVAEKRFGPKIYQGGVVPGKYIRIVEIPGWDVEACGGTHVKNTCEIQFIKILNVEKIHDGVVRFTYAAGDSAVKHTWDYYEAVERARKTLSVSLVSMPEKVSELVNNLEELGDKISKLIREVQKYRIYKLINEFEKCGPYNVLILRDDIDNLIILGEELDKVSKEYILVGYNKVGRGYNMIIRVGDNYMKKGVSAKDIMDYFIKYLIKGGGRGEDKYARFGGVGDVNKKSIEEVLMKYAEEHRTE